MGTTYSRYLPPLPPLPRYPMPTSLSTEPHRFQSKLPLAPSITPPPLPPSLSIPPFPIPLLISHHIVPECFTTSPALLPYPDFPDSAYSDSDADGGNGTFCMYTRLPCSQLGFSDSPLHRFLFHHALLGLTSRTSTATLRLLSSARECDITEEAGRFDQTLVSLNLYAMSVLLRSVPGFILCLYESSYFGYAGLEVWMEWFDGNKFWHVYVYGLEQLWSDVENICRIIEGVNVGGGWRKCWGVVGADEDVHKGSMGESMSRFIGEIWRRRPRVGGPFLVPDSLVGDRPPLFPGEVFGMDAAAFERLEKGWGFGEEVKAEWHQGKERWDAGVVTGGGEAVSRERFENEWGKVRGCKQLKRVVGTLACGFLRRENLERGAITNMENGKDGVEVVLQARQFCKLREVLCGVAKDRMEDTSGPTTG